MKHRTFCQVCNISVYGPYFNRRTKQICFMLFCPVVITVESEVWYVRYFSFPNQSTKLGLSKPSWPTGLGWVHKSNVCLIWNLVSFDTHPTVHEFIYVWIIWAQDQDEAWAHLSGNRMFQSLHPCFSSQKTFYILNWHIFNFYSLLLQDPSIWLKLKFTEAIDSLVSLCINPKCAGWVKKHQLCTTKHELIMV